MVEILMTYKNRILLVCAILIFCVAVYFAAFYMIQNSEGFRFINSSINTSKNLEAVIGKVIAIQLSPFEPGSNEIVGKKHVTDVVVDVKGSNRSVQLHIIAKKNQDVWTIAKSTSADGQTIDITK